MSKSPTSLKAILIFDPQEMKENEARIASILTFRNRRDLRRQADCFGILMSSLNAYHDVNNWQNKEAYIVEFSDVVLAKQQLFQASLSGIGLLRAYRYDKDLIKEELGILVHLLHHVSIISDSAAESLRLIKQQARKYPNLVAKNETDKMKSAYTMIDEQLDEYWDNLINAVSQVLKRLEIE